MIGHSFMTYEQLAKLAGQKVRFILTSCRKVTCIRYEL